MALIKCSECGKEISDKAKMCVNCGNPISNNESKLIIYGYTDSYLINPPVKIFLNDKEVGQVAKGQMFELELKQDSVILFKCNMRKAKLDVKSGKITKVKITWNRLTGQMIPQIIDYNVADNSF